MQTLPCDNTPSVSPPKPLHYPSHLVGAKPVAFAVVLNGEPIVEQEAVVALLAVGVVNLVGWVRDGVINEEGVSEKWKKEDDGRRRKERGGTRKHTVIYK